MIEYFRSLSDRIFNKTIYLGKYKTNSEGIILSCYFNPYNSKLRYDIFMDWYKTIKHLPHYIVEGSYKGDKYNLIDVENENKMIVSLESRLWHKEALLNIGIDEISKRKVKPKYLFWLDTDIRFTNLNWFDDSCKKLADGANFIQPFKLIKHLQKGDDFLETNTPESLLVNNAEFYLNMSSAGKRMPETDTWFSFAYRHDKGYSTSSNYESHGHVGMAWGGRLEILEKIKFYDKAIIGGADHVMAHAISGETNHCCIKKTFGEDLDLHNYSIKLDGYSKGKLAYMDGVIYHQWHGDIDKRDYYNRITYSGKEISKKMVKENGFYKSDNEDIFDTYMLSREVLDDTSDFNIEVTSANTSNEFSGFGGGSFGGGGVSGSWDNDNPISDTPSETFTNTEAFNTFS